MERKKKWMIAGGAAVAAVVAAAGGVAASGGDDSEVPITGDALIEATNAALDHTGGGTVTETEVGDEESLYEVEITMPDGRQIDVQLDENFEVVGSEADHEGEDDEDD